MVTRLATGVWWVDLQGTNAYLVDDGALTLIDAGMPVHAGRLKRAIGQVGTVAEVERVLITHADFDHVGGLAGLDLDATVYVGAADEPYLTGAERPPVTNRKGLLQRVTDTVRTPPDLPVETVNEGDTVGSFRAHETPGHTPGHTAFVSNARSVAFVGDMVSGSGTDVTLAPWYLAYDQDRARRSLLAFADRAPAYDIACQGHGTPMVGDGSERVAAAARRTRTATEEGGDTDGGPRTTGR